MPSRIEIKQEDCLTQPVEAIIHVSNASLMPITKNEELLFAKAGPKLKDECAHVAPCPPGEARITRGYNLNFNFIIHTTPPRWGGGENGEDQALISCYQKSLELARSFEIRSLALPPLIEPDGESPETRAAQIAMQEIIAFLKRDKDIRSLILACPDRQSVERYEQAFDAITT